MVAGVTIVSLLTYASHGLVFHLLSGVKLMTCERGRVTAAG